jgi:MFS family permease
MSVAAPRKAILAVVIGNWLEFYDFLVYTFFAVMIGQAFFPGHSDVAKLLGSLATFGAGFLTRPLGAALIGAYADRAGRRAALSVTILLMALGSGLIAITPGYAQIGIAAPLILLVARLIQGFSCGGEVGPATTYLLESAPLKERVGFTAWQIYSQQIASISGSLVGVALAATLSKEDLYAWGWRVPFFIGMLIAPVGLYIRRQLPETMDKGEAHKSTGAVLGNLFRHHSRAIILGIFTIAGATISTYVFNYMSTFAIATLHLPALIATTITLVGSAASICGVFVGVVIDRFGRKRVLIGSRLVFIALVYPVFVLLTSSAATAPLIIGLNVLLNFVFGIGTSGLIASLTEAFPKAVRSSGLAILYAASVAIFGGTTQFVVTWLIQATGSPLVPAWYQIVANLASIVAILMLLPRDAKIAEAPASA